MCSVLRLLAMAALVCIAAALHEDQAGLADWQRAQTGRPVGGAFVSPRGAFDGALFALASRQGVVAMLSAANGELLQRQVLPGKRGEVGVSFFAVSQDADALQMVTSDQKGCSVELWRADAAVGLVWDVHGLCRPSSAATLALQVVGMTSGKKRADTGVALLSEERLVLLDRDTGKKKGDFARTESIRWVGLAQSKKKGLFVFGMDGEGILRVEKLAGTGLSLEVMEIEGASGVDDGAIVGAGQAIIFASRKKIALLSLFDYKVYNTNIAVKNPSTLKPASQNSDVFLLDNSAFIVDKEGKSCSVVVENVATLGVSEAGELIALDSSLKATWIDSQGKKRTLSKFPDANAAEGRRGRAMDAFIGGNQAIVTFQDDSVIGIDLTAGKKLFVREEALAEVTGIVTVEMTPSADAATLSTEAARAFSHGDAASIWLFRLKDQIRTIQRFTVSLSDASRELLSSLMAKLRGEVQRSEGYSESELFSFGFRRALVISTKSGKHFGINSKNGEIIWAEFAPDSAGTETVLFATRFREAGDEHPAEVAFVSKSNGLVIWRNGLTGTVTGLEMLENPIMQVVALPADLEGGQRPGMEEDVSPAHPLAILDETLTFHVLPKQIERTLMDANKEMFKKLHFSLYDREKRILQGFASNPGGMSALETWSFVIPESHKVLAIKGHEDGALNNPGIKQGDGSVLIKYVNPHLMLVLTENDQGELLATILDGVSGKVCKRMSHKNATGPVQAVLFDHMVVYTYFNYESKRTELSSVGLYEGSIDKNGLNLWTPRESDDIGTGGKFSSFDVSFQSPNVLQRTFYLLQAVRGLGATRTRYGISDRRLLVALEKGSINMVLPQMVDPRRPLGTLTDIEKQEGLMAYEPLLTLHPTATISYNLTLPRLRNIESFPTKLESTSLVAAAGLDLFFTRVMPSKGFDLLDEDFNFQLLISLIAGLSLGALYLYNLAEKQKLASNWK